MMCAWTVDEEKIELSPDFKALTETALIEPEPESATQPFISSEKDLKALEQHTKKEGAALFEKKPSGLTEEERMSKECEPALELLKENNGPKAELALLEVLGTSPKNHLARVELVKFYLNNNRVSEAEKQLDLGLKADPEYPKYLQMMAIVYDKKDNPEKALDYLSKLPPEKRHNKTTMALFGHLYHQTGQFLLARQQYARLLHYEPNNTVWLLGLSTALDGEGEKRAAIEGYEKLQQNDAIDKSVKDYIQTRLKALKG